MIPDVPYFYFVVFSATVLRGNDGNVATVYSLKNWRLIQYEHIRGADTAEQLAPFVSDSQYWMLKAE